MNNHKYNLIRDSSIIILGIVIAVILAKTGALKDFLAGAKEWKILGSFLAGMFFVSAFTAAPAIVVLVEIMQLTSVITVALFGGLGALAGDFLIFRFVKNSFLGDIGLVLNEKQKQKLVFIFRSKFYRWIAIFLGAVIIASPFPDEIGLTMMGLSKMNTKVFVPVSFILNFLGILAIGLIAL